MFKFINFLLYVKEDEPEELNELKQEAQLPIDEILKKYINREPKNVKSKDKVDQPGSSNSSVSISKLTSVFIAINFFFQIKS